MRLRASSTTVDLMAVVAGNELAEPGVPHGISIRAFALAALQQDAGRLTAARSRLVERAGERVAADVAGVCAHFDGINRVASGTGVRVNEFVTMPDEIREYMRRRHGQEHTSDRASVSDRATKGVP